MLLSCTYEEHRGNRRASPKPQPLSPARRARRAARRHGPQPPGGRARPAAVHGPARSPDRRRTGRAPASPRTAGAASARRGPVRPEPRARRDPRRKLVALFYADSSALVKLVRDEPESAVLRTFLADADLVSCELVLTELPR